VPLRNYGWASFAIARASRAYPDHERMREWLGQDFDPDAFEPARVNAAFQHLR
jgi:hypothetical protein